MPPPPTSPSGAIGATLRIEVRNAAGPKHAQLLELLEHYGHDDLIGACKSDGGHLLAERQLGLAGSTYCGVKEFLWCCPFRKFQGVNNSPLKRVKWIKMLCVLSRLRKSWGRQHHNNRKS